MCSVEALSPDWTHLGVPRPDPVTFTVPPLEAPQALTTMVPGHQIKREHRDYVVTFVNKYGEEGRASFSSPTAQDADADAPATITLPPPPGDPEWAVTHIRIYRVQSGNVNGEYKLDAPYLFVAEVPIGTATYQDTVPVDLLGEELSKVRADPPPEGLRGVVALDNGALAGFVGNNLYFSEPNMWHAWPCYQTLEDCIKALVQVGSQLYVITDGRPYLVDVSRPPEEVNDCCYPIAHIKEPLPLVSDARGAAATYNGAIWPSTMGLVRMTGASVSIITGQQFSSDDWNDLHPHTFKSAVQEGRYYGFGAKGGFVYDFTDGIYADGDVGANSRAFMVDLLPNSVFVSRKGVMYLGFMDEIRIWNDGPANMKYRWRTKLHDLGTNVAWAAGMVKFEAGSCDGPVASPVTVRLFDGCGDLMFVTEAVSERPFTMPLGIYRHAVEIELEGTAEVSSLTLAASVRDLYTTTGT